MNQSAVEWFVEEMFNQGYLNDKPLTIKNIERFVNQAKEMEKEQIMDAYNNGDNRSAELYYNETFKSE
jgi:HEPN domain-containing protein